jgi:hypothetical protein
VKRLIALGLLACAATSAAAHPGRDRDLSVVEKAAGLKPGQYVWEPKSASTGPLFLVIDLTAQRARVYRNGVPFAVSTISTGSKGRETPTGVFTILQKELVHRSRTYDNAPMPYMQRLTWKGVAMHAGNLPGRASSHGCIRLPKAFAKLLYGVTELGTPVMITNDAEIAEQERRATGYQRATEEYAHEMAEQRAAAERALAEFDRAKVAHEKALLQHNAKMAKPKSEVASQ